MSLRKATCHLCSCKSIPAPSGSKCSWGGNVPKVQKMYLQKCKQNVSKRSTRSESGLRPGGVFSFFSVKLQRGGNPCHGNTIVSSPPRAYSQRTVKASHGHILRKISLPVTFCYNNQQAHSVLCIIKTSSTSTAHTSPSLFIPKPYHLL